ncbi:hypothetical protein D9M71_438920 [compost metagenome]
MVAPAVVTAAAVVAPSPKATLLATDALALLPMAMLLAAEALATGPTAIESTPVAAESARVELAWKYLIPPPSSMLVIKVSCTPSASSTLVNAAPTLVAAPVVPLMALA